MPGSMSSLAGVFWDDSRSLLVISNATNLVTASNVRRDGIEGNRSSGTRVGKIHMDRRYKCARANLSNNSKVERQIVGRSISHRNLVLLEPLLASSNDPSNTPRELQYRKTLRSEPIEQMHRRRSPPLPMTIPCSLSTHKPGREASIGLVSLGRILLASAFELRGAGAAVGYGHRVHD